MEKNIRQMTMIERFKYLNEKKRNMFNTKNKKDIDTICPECGHKFNVMK